MGVSAEQLAARFGLPVEQAIEHFVREVRGLPSGGWPMSPALPALAIC